MIRSIRHLVGSEGDWITHDLVIPKGEIAFLESASGRYRMKIGNGTNKFSELPFTDGNLHSISSGSLLLSHATYYKAKGALTDITLMAPEYIDEDFYCEVSFISGDDATEFETSGVTAFRFTGDGTADGSFIPEANMRYTIFIWYDGELQGTVRGIPNG